MKHIHERLSLISQFLSYLSSVSILSILLSKSIAHSVLHTDVVSAAIIRLVVLALF